MNLPVRLMFQDEARFGRMSDPRSCWAPAPHRPVVNLAMIREFRYEYAAVSPWDGCLDFIDRRQDEHGQHVPLLGSGQSGSPKRVHRNGA